MPEKRLQRTRESYETMDYPEVAAIYLITHKYGITERTRLRLAHIFKTPDGLVIEVE